MISAGIKEVKNNLSKFIERVKAGEEVLITERGKPVARIVKEQEGDKSIRAALGPLVQRGLVSLPSRSLLRNCIPAVEAPGKPVAEIVIEDRR
ncbi:MAG: type II toxin-antitoxin system prevent-host-death family antitoxin [Desulfobacteraceae bacterium]|nr:MAG: type II toxin-antitoxin system prevent-host-death family antitoxin [Desulfobacteraceae bacterium]